MNKKLFQKTLEDIESLSHINKDGSIDFDADSVSERFSALALYWMSENYIQYNDITDNNTLLKVVNCGFEYIISIKYETTDMLFHVHRTNIFDTPKQIKCSEIFKIFIKE